MAGVTAEVRREFVARWGGPERPRKPRVPGLDRCGLCGSQSVTDLAHGHGEPRVACHACGGQYWRKWYNRKEWDEYING